MKKQTRIYKFDFRACFGIKNKNLIIKPCFMHNYR